MFVRKKTGIKMKHNREYEIAWQGLKPGVSVFEYYLDDKFFEQDSTEREFKDLDAQVNLRFDKKTNFFMCHFDIDGSITVPCDRCGEDFKLQLWDEFDLMIKLSGEADEEHDEDADVVFVPRSETVIDFRDWIYEFLMLSIPLQKVHPDKADGTAGCNPDVLKLLNSFSSREEKESGSDIWKGLEAFKKNDKEEKTD